VRPLTRVTAAAHTALSNMEQVRVDKTRNRLQIALLVRSSTMADLPAGAIPTTRLHRTARVCNRLLEAKATIHHCTRVTLHPPPMAE